MMKSCPHSLFSKTHSVLAGCLALSLGLALSVQAQGPPGQGGSQAPRVTISQVTVNFEPPETLIISGDNFVGQGTTVVTLGELGELFVSGLIPTEITADFPLGGIPDGDYLLTVTTGNNARGTYDLTIGAVGPKGEPGLGLDSVTNFTVTNSTTCTETCTRPETTYTGGTCATPPLCTSFSIFKQTPGCTATCTGAPAVADCGTAPNRFLVSCVTGSHSGGMAKSCAGAAPQATVTVPASQCSNVSGFPGCDTVSTCSCTTPSETGTATDTQTATALCAEAG